MQLRYIKGTVPPNYVYAAVVEWEGAPSTTVYAYVFGREKADVAQVASVIREAVITREFEENYDFWVDWLGESDNTDAEDIWEGISGWMKLKGPSRHEDTTLEFFNADIPAMLMHLQTYPLAIYFSAIDFSLIKNYCDQEFDLSRYIVNTTVSEQLRNALMNG